MRQSYCARYIYRLDVCPSVCLSVTRWYCVETAQPIVKLSSLLGSPVILVFEVQTFSRNSNGNTPTGELNARGRKKFQFPTNILRRQIYGYLLSQWPVPIYTAWWTEACAWTTCPESLRVAERPGLEPATSRLQVRRLNHYTPPRHTTREPLKTRRARL